MAPTTLRVLHDPPLPGAANMARDDALLELVGLGTSPPTLRFYQWDPPTISLGYFQKYADYAALPPPAGELAVVRRPTGGGAILHDHELTYSIALPLGHPLLTGGPNRLYELAHTALLDALAQASVSAAWSGFTDDSGPAKGPFFCFARRHRFDVLVGADKLAGSAQRRTKSAVLQHGSVVLERRFDQQPAASITGATEFAARALADAMTASIAKITGASFQPGAWNDEEIARAADLIVKHTSQEWLMRM
jgi:lipoate-protein ligase A